MFSFVEWSCARMWEPQEREQITQNSSLAKNMVFDKNEFKFVESPSSFSLNPKSRSRGKDLVPRIRNVLDGASQNLQVFAYKCCHLVPRWEVKKRCLLLRGRTVNAPLHRIYLCSRANESQEYRGIWHETQVIKTQHPAFTKARSCIYSLFGTL